MNVSFSSRDSIIEPQNILSWEGPAVSPKNQILCLRAASKCSKLWQTLCCDYCPDEPVSKSPEPGLRTLWEVHGERGIICQLLYFHVKHHLHPCFPQWAQCPWISSEVWLFLFNYVLKLFLCLLRGRTSLLERSSVLVCRSNFTFFQDQRKNAKTYCSSMAWVMAHCLLQICSIKMRKCWDSQGIILGKNIIHKTHF